MPLARGALSHQTLRYIGRLSPLGRRQFSASSGGLGFHPIKEHLFPPSKPLYRHASTPLTTSLIQAPMTYGQPFTGADDAPQRLIEAGLKEKLNRLGWRIEDSKIDFDSIIKAHGSKQDTKEGARNHNVVGRTCELISEVVAGKLKEGKFPAVLGGDHSISLGSVHGVLTHRPDTGIIWVDAHADINTPETSESGNMHGMPVGLLLEGEESASEGIEGLQWLSPAARISPSQIVYVGLRDVDVKERAILRSKNIKCFTMFDVDRYGIGGVMDRAIEHLLGEDPERPIHLSYDIDAVDPFVAPSTGTTVRGGLTYREAHFVAESVAQTGNLSSFDLVEVNPQLTGREGADETVGMGLQIITSLMGKSIL